MITIHDIEAFRDGWDYWTPETKDDGWRDIESAPKDGTEILVWDGEYTITQWIDGDWTACIDECPPTHWRPLPAPPK
jgi:hypothetical protein